MFRITASWAIVSIGIRLTALVTTASTYEAQLKAMITLIAAV